jgi:transposase
LQQATGNACVPHATKKGHSKFWKCTPKVGQKFWGFIMRETHLCNRRHPVSEKLLLAQQYDSGIPVRVLSAKTGIHRAQIGEWIRRYHAGGIEGFSTRNAPYPVSLKTEIVLRVIRNGLSLRQAAIDYRITYNVIRTWVKRAQAQGIEALSIDGRGCHLKRVMNKKPISREQALLLENERLRAENAYLKKLKALVEARIAREDGNVHKPSRN